MIKRTRIILHSNWDQSMHGSIKQVNYNNKIYSNFTEDYYNNIRCVLDNLTLCSYAYKLILIPVFYNIN